MDKAQQQNDPEQELQRRRKAEKLLAKKAAAREVQNQQYKDHLRRERAFSDQTQRKFFDSWETLCAQVKCEQMVEELRQQQQCFGTVFDRKNGCIDRLLAVRDEIGEIHDKCLRRLDKIIDYFIRLKDFMTATMLQRYDADCLNLFMDFREEAASKEEHACSQMEILDASLEELLQKMKQDEKADSDWLLEQNTINKCAQIEKCEIMRDKKYKEMDDLYCQLRTTLDRYFQTVLFPERKKSYDQLLYYTQLEQQGIEKRRCQIAIAQLKKTQLEHTLALVRIGGRRRLRTQHNYRRLLEHKLSVLKEKQQRLDEDHQTRLKQTCSITHRIQQILSEHLSWGEKIVKQASICAQYETEQDQQFASKWFRDGASESDLDVEDPRYFEYLMHKINRVEAIAIILREEKIALERENDALRVKFKAFCKLHKTTDPEQLLLCGQEVIPES
ncbi:AGAP006596-PA-like protein [Anopheles sinensis]|uniref:Dynein regulatory complex subunit 2 n=1 Tax=Anopheles sinensis TaxID=74873 RepID=A0A084WGH2_ANOSI|nr:AGAP006596-PA-like protein [Anopheles sinensis]